MTGSDHGQPIDTLASAAEFLAALGGAWAGSGQGKFPTIDSFEYRESLVVTAHDSAPLLQYVQQTWRLTDGGEVPSHWETGFVWAHDDGGIEIANVQGPDRTERLLGSLHRSAEGGWVLELNSVDLSGDSRMVASSRVIRLEGDVLTYDMAMETDRVSPSQNHLVGQLRRVG